MKRFSFLMMSALLAGCGAAQPPTGVPEPRAAETAKQPTLAAAPVPTSQPQPTKSAPPETKGGSKKGRRPKGRFEPYPGPERPRPRLSVSVVAFSPDGKYMLTGYGVSDRPEKVGKRFQLLRLWDVASGQELYGFEEVQRSVVGVSFLPDSRHAVVGTSDGFVSVWDMNIEKLKVVRRFQVGKPTFYCMALSPDGKRLLSSWFSYPNGYLSLAEVSSGRLLWTSECPVRGASPVAFSPDGKHAFASFCPVQTDRTDLGLMELWDMQKGKRTRAWKQQNDFRFPLAFSPDGKSVLSIRDKRLVIWELATGREIRQFERPYSPRRGCNPDIEPGTAHFTPDGKSIVSGDSDVSLRRWDVATGKQVDVARIPDSEIDRYADAEYLDAGGQIREEAYVHFSACGRFALSIIGSDIYYPPGPPPREWDSESVDSRLVLWDTVKLKALGPAVRKQIMLPLDPSIR